MNFLDFIFDNFFIVLIIAFGIINLFSRGGKSKTQEQRRQQEQPGKPASSRMERAERESQEEPKGSVLGRMAQSMESAFEEISGQFEQEKPQETIADQQRKQYEQLKKEVQNEYAEYTDEESHKTLKKKSVKKQHKGHSEKVENADLEHLMTRKGLMQGVIMSEVLGPPRALKPYRSITEQRKQ